MALLFDYRRPPPVPVKTTPVHQKLVELQMTKAVSKVTEYRKVGGVTRIERPQVDYNPWGYVKTPSRWGTVVVTVDELFNELLWLRNKGYGKEELVLQMRKQCNDPGFQRPYERKGVVILPYQSAEDVVL